MYSKENRCFLGVVFQFVSFLKTLFFVCFNVIYFIKTGVVRELITSFELDFLKFIFEINPTNQNQASSPSRSYSNINMQNVDKLTA